MKKPTDLALRLTRFLTQYLSAQRSLSANTIKSYRDVFSLLLRYCRDVKGVAPERLRIQDLDAPLVLEFLEHLESSRGCRPSTRNHRLAALHAFFRYLQSEEPERLLQCQRILSIPFVRCPRPMVDYLTKEELAVLLEQPDFETAEGRRDGVLLSVLYDTGARVQELIDLSAKDVVLGPPAHVRLTGKGRKMRAVPLMRNTVDLLRPFMGEHGLDRPERLDEPLFQSRLGQRLSRSGVRYILTKYATMARVVAPRLAKRISPHTLRHSKAIHLLQVGNPLVVIRDILGHVSVETTEMYAKVDLEMKKKALEKAPTITPKPSRSSWQKEQGLLDWLGSS